jgi:hypothetical protein
MRYYQKKLDTETDLDGLHKKIYRDGLIHAMESMLEMVTPYVKANANKGGRRTRRRRRSKSKN